MAFLRPGPNNNGLRGRMGNQVYAEDGAATIVKEFVPPSNPDTVPQIGARTNLTRASRAWATLTDTQRASWTAFGKLLKSKGVLSGNSRPLNGFQAFAALTSKFLQLNPAGAIPTSAPGSKFAGDTLTIAVGTGLAGTFTVTPSAANATGVTTEILVQRLSATYRKPRPAGYKHAAFIAFADTSAHVVSEPTGIYAVAYRFVKIATGEETDLIPVAVQSVALELELAA